MAQNYFETKYELVEKDRESRSWKSIHCCNAYPKMLIREIKIWQISFGKIGIPIFWSEIC